MDICVFQSSFHLSCTKTYPMLQTIEKGASNLNTHCPIIMISFRISALERKKQVWRGHFWGTNEGIAIPCVTSCYQRHLHILGLHILINITLDFLFHTKPFVYSCILYQSWTPCPGEDIFGTNLAIYKKWYYFEKSQDNFPFFFSVKMKLWNYNIW